LSNHLPDEDIIEKYIRQENKLNRRRFVEKIIFNYPLGLIHVLLFIFGFSIGVFNDNSIKIADAFPGMDIQNLKILNGVFYGGAATFLGILILPNIRRVFSSFFDLERNIRSDVLDNYASYYSINERIKVLEREKSTGLKDLNIEEISTNVSKQLSKSMSKDVLNEIETKYSSDILKNSALKSVDAVVSNLISALEKERSVVSTRTATNLALGIIIAGSGLYVLYQTLTVIDFNESDWKATAIQLVARLSVVIVIEIFAYFFLNLYKNGLQEIKYYRNEITNSMSKQTAIKLAAMDESLKNIPDLITNLAETERNFILKKGERTLSSEQNQSSYEESSIKEGTLVKAFEAVIEKLKTSSSNGK